MTNSFSHWGYDKTGHLTDDPSLILESWRTLPVGYWKGAGLSFLLDVLAAVLAGGLATHEISQKPAEMAASQVYVAIDIAKLGNHSSIPHIINIIINDYHQSVPIDASHKITFPGERVLQTRQKNLVQGVPVLESVWEEILGFLEE